MKEKIKGFINLMRPKQWFKSFFLLVGAGPAILLMPPVYQRIIILLLLGILNLIMLQGVTYAINDVHDVERDRKHYSKKKRPIASGLIKIKEAKIFALFLFTIANLIMFFVDWRIIIINIIFLTNSIAYSMPPLSLKHRPFLDIISAGLNHPLRVLVGWYLFEPFNKGQFMLMGNSTFYEFTLSNLQGILFNAPQRVYHLTIQFSSVTITMFSIIFTTFFIACFLLLSKRLAERVYFKKEAVKYRPVQKYYTDRELRYYIYIILGFIVLSLLVFFWSLKPLLISSLPIYFLLFIMYYKMIYTKSKVAKTPEKIFKQKSIMITAFFALGITLILLIF